MGLPLQRYIDYFCVCTAVWAVKYLGLPLQHFLNYFSVPRAVESTCLP
jgi:hypothetical protein